MKTKAKAHILPFGLLAALPLLAATYQFMNINPFASVETSARGINEEGDVVGDFATAADESAGIEHGFLLHQGKFSKIDFPNSIDTDANGINNEGVIVGTYAAKSDGNDHGYVLDENGYHKLPDPPANFAFPDYNAINDERHVVGGFLPFPPAPPFGNRGFLLKNGTYIVLNCGKDQTEANGINDDGDIVGECTDLGATIPYKEHAFLLRKGKYLIFDFPGAGCDGTVATGINDDGVIVGTYEDTNCGEHGFVVKGFPEHPVWSTVNRPGAADTKLAGISDDGALVGTSTSTTGVDTGFKANKRED